MKISLYSRDLLEAVPCTLAYETAFFKNITESTRATSADLLRWLLARLKTFGITRVGDLTGLDRLGIPVMQACRPLARSNVVTQGKGSTSTEAALGAVMECLETWAAERIPEGAVAHIPVPEVPAPWRDAYDPHDRDARCVLGWNLAANRATLVPEALVATDYTVTSAARQSPLPRATSGLGAGASLHAAIVQGLAECIEREAFDRALRTHGFFECRQVAPETIGDPLLKAWLDRAASVGTQVGIWQLETIAGLVGFWVRLIEDDGPDQMLPLPADGMTSAADPVIAVRKAYMEAAQGRMATISGAREDITRAHYPTYVDQQQLDAERRRIRVRSDALNFPRSVVPCCPHPDVRLRALTAAMRAEALPDPIVVPLAAVADSDQTIHVVRVLVPGFQVIPGSGMAGHA